MHTFSSDQIQALKAIVTSERFFMGDSHRELHRRDYSHHQGSLPAGIIWPVDTKLEHGASYALMRQIKKMIDPKGLLNPGKIFLKNVENGWVAFKI